MSVSKRFACVLLLVVGGLALPTARAECPSLFPGDGPYGVGGSPLSVAIADLDGDGDADLAVANGGFVDGGATVSILLNNGDGTFADDVLYGVATSPNFVAMGDLDGDGDADVAVSHWINDDDNVSILLNNGDGTFGAAVFYRAGDFPNSVAIADLDGDGDADLAVANQESDNVSILLNNGDGTFADDVLYDVGDSPSFVVSADLDGDGDADLAVTNRLDDNVSILLNNGDGTFAADVLYDVGDSPSFVVSADLDGDGDADLGALNQFSEDLYILFNAGDGTFSLDAVYQLADTSWGAGIGDLDGDGDIDLAVAYAGSETVGVRFNNGDGTFADDVLYDAGADPWAVGIGDLDADGDADLAVVDNVSNTVSVLLNEGDGTFGGGGDVVYELGDGPGRVAMADLDGDGDADLAVVNSASDDISLLLNNGDGTFAEQVIYDPGFDPYSSVIIADLDEDGDADLAVLVSVGGIGKVAVLLNDGNASFTTDGLYDAGHNPAHLLSADLDGDGDADLAVADPSYPDGSVTVLLNNGDATFADPVTFWAGTIIRSMAVGDLDGDGDADLALALWDYDLSTIQVLWNAGDGTFASHSGFDAGDDPRVVAIGDVDGDGDADMAVTTGQNFGPNNVVKVLLNDGDGSFAELGYFVVGEQATAVAIADLDADGDGDLVVVNVDDFNVHVLLNGGGFFDPDDVSIFGVGNTPFHMAVGDLNGDGAPDLAVTNNQSNNVSILLNLCSQIHNLTQGTNHATIQAAVDSAFTGDLIEVSPGTYFENIDFLDKDITVRSTDPLDPDAVAATIIDGGGVDTVVVLSAGEISGFTITGGVNTGIQAGGVHATGGAVVSHNVITANVAGDDGGGVTATDNAVVRNNRITFNEAGDVGGGVSGRGDSVVIDNYIAFNEATSGGGGVGALGNCVIRNNTIVLNSSSGDGGGIIAGLSPFLLSNIVAFSSDGAGIHVIGSDVTADYNCVFSNFDGNYGGDAVAGPNDLNVDPQLDADELHLQDSSPCVDAGDPDLVPLTDETDIDGENRIHNDRVDIGADEVTVCEGDANGDGTVDPLDSGFVLARFGCPVGTGDPSCDAADVNGDGAVDPLDSGFVLARFGECP